MKRAMIVYAAIIAANLFVQLIIGEIFNAMNVDSGGFWPRIVFSLVLYSCFALVLFIGFWYRPQFRGRELLREYQINTKVKADDVIKTILLAASSIVAFMLVQEAVSQFFELISKTTEESIPLSINGWGQYFASLLALVILPAIIEELLFRGLILKALCPYGRIKAVIASALLFCLFHLNPDQTIYQFIMGIILAVIALRTGSLVMSMLFHFLNNFFLITYIFVSGVSESATTWTAMTISTTVICCLLGGAVIACLLKSLRNGQWRSEWKFGRKPFVAMENLGYALCVIFVGALWITILVAR